MSRFLFYILFAVVLISCTRRNEELSIAPSNCYAKGFAVEEREGFKVVEIRNPWDTLKLLQRIILLPKNSELPNNLPQGILLRTPIKRAAVYASLHCGIIDKLGKSESIVGVCDAYYVADQQLKNRIKNGEVADMGSSFLPDIETILSVNPEVVILSPYKDSSHGKVAQLGIPIIEMADYMEDTPLARTEWIKFMAMLFECDSLANTIFKATETEYNNLAELGRGMKQKPSLICELKTGSVWYQPGGDSYMAKLYADAGIDYLWSDNSNKGSLSLSFEDVLARGADADLWLIKYSDEKDKTLKLLSEEYPPYKNFKPYKEKNVWGVNALKVPFYEEMPLYPQKVLRDLLLLAHPQIFSSADTTIYYKHLEDE